MSDRVLGRIRKLYTAEQIDPSVLCTELFRQYPDHDFTSVQSLQLDLMITNVYNSILLNPEISPKLIMEDKVERGLAPRFPYLGTGTFKSRTGDIDLSRFYVDNALSVPLKKAQSLQILDKYQQKVKELAMSKEVLHERASRLDEKAGKWRNKADKIRQQAYRKNDVMNVLGDQVQTQIENWTGSMDSLVKQLMGRLEIEQVGEFVGKYSEFKQALKRVCNRMKWDIEDKARTKVQKRLGPVTTAMKSFRSVGYGLTDMEEFTGLHFVMAEEMLKSIGQGYATKLVERKKADTQKLIGIHKAKSKKHVMEYKKTGNPAHKIKSEMHRDKVKQYAAYMNYFDQVDIFFDKNGAPAHYVDNDGSVDNSLPKAVRQERFTPAFRGVRSEAETYKQKKIASHVAGRYGWKGAGKRFKKEAGMSLKNIEAIKRQRKLKQQNADVVDNSVRAIEKQKASFAAKRGRMKMGSQAKQAPKPKELRNLKQRSDRGFSTGRTKMPKMPTMTQKPVAADQIDQQPITPAPVKQMAPAAAAGPRSNPTAMSSSVKPVSKDIRDGNTMVWFDEPAIPMNTSLVQTGTNGGQVNMSLMQNVPNFHQQVPQQHAMDKSQTVNRQPAQQVPEKIMSTDEMIMKDYDSLVKGCTADK